jgi:hypothetical protein
MARPFIEAADESRRDRLRRQRGHDLIALLVFVGVATWVFWAVPA